MKKVYFALSIRGEEMDKRIYRMLLEKLKEQYEIVNEQTVINCIEGKRETISDKEIYQRDIGWIAMSDMIVAECSKASLGVGYELAYGEKLNKPIYILYQTKYENKLSAMINGNTYFKKKAYDLTRIATQRIDEIIC